MKPVAVNVERIEARIAALDVADVRAWLIARLQNCRRLADQRVGADRDGWLEDAAYFSAAIGLINWTEAGRTALTEAKADAL